MFWLGLVFIGMVFSLAVWCVSIGIQLLFPEHPGEVDDALDAWLRRIDQEKTPVPVGAREITLAKRHYQRHRLYAPYTFAHGVSLSGLPENWLEDVYLRQN